VACQNRVERKARHHRHHRFPDPRSQHVSTGQQFVTGVDFVPVPTHDLEAAVEFYGETIGLTRSAYRPERHFAEFETGNLTLSVIDAEAMGIPYSVSGNAIALHVEDVAEARSTLETRGVSFAGETFDTGVCHMALFSDPDGNALMLHHRYAPRVPDA
jgi:predicted enzyme related to lactoylglutathione lyase